ncbi:uncharacterized protein EMH_0065020 [Eimeria mitis]|uniref:Uncharacterized protein n=1 Tax=Eimeria mitis TaxID=44415 RepID=U6K2K3_9EIME|nr:uncharacterized protein EMH_0065020 [Eimeria mitis]CDJ31221.1 hypothetical protein EMH_0065020 [Eimeria mitis]
MRIGSRYRRAKRLCPEHLWGGIKPAAQPACYSEGCSSNCTCHTGSQMYGKITATATVVDSDTAKCIRCRPSNICKRQPPLLRLLSSDLHASHRSVPHSMVLSILGKSAQKVRAVSGSTETESIQLQCIEHGTARKALTRMGLTLASLPVYAVAQSLRLRFADDRQKKRIGKSTGVKYPLSSKTGHINVPRGFYVGAVHHNIATQGEVQVRSPDDAIEVSPPGTDEIALLSALATACASSIARRVERLFQGKRSEEAHMQCSGTKGNGGDMHAFRRDGLLKTAVLGESIQLTHDEQ